MEGSKQEPEVIISESGVKVTPLQSDKLTYSDKLWLARMALKIIYRIAALWFYAGLSSVTDSEFKKWTKGTSESFGELLQEEK